MKIQVLINPKPCTSRKRQTVAQRGTPFTAAHEAGHCLIRRGHYGHAVNVLTDSYLDLSNPNFPEECNLMVSGTSATNSLTASKRLLKFQCEDARNSELSNN